MPAAMLILAIFASLGWFFLGYNLGTQDKQAKLDKMPPPAPSTRVNGFTPRKLDV